MTPTANTRVLIVEDEGIVAMNMQTKLNSLGYEVTGIAHTGEHAIELAADPGADIVLMDIKLKGEMDGIEAASRIRELCGVPIIFITAYGAEPILERAKVTGPFGYILKPFQDRDLMISIEMALYKHRAERALAESERKYRLLFEQSPLPMWVVDSRTMKLAAANNASLKLYGYGGEEMAGMDIRSICRAAEKAGEMPSTGRYMSLHKRRGGDEIMVEVISNEIEFEGSPCLLMLLNDVTEEVRSIENARRQQSAVEFIYSLAATRRDSLREMAQSSASALSRMLKADAVFIEIFGSPMDLKVVASSRPEAMEGRQLQLGNSHYRWIEAVRSGIAPRTLCEAPATGEPCSPLYEMMKPGCALCVPMIDSSNSAIGAIEVFAGVGVCFRDDDVKLVEIFSRYIANESERESMGSKLDVARKMEVIGKLAAGVAHEVRNPLNAIMALTDALASDLADKGEYKPFLMHMKSQVNRLSILMSDLLDLGKPIEQMDLRRQNVIDLCRGAIDVWTHSGYSSTHDLTFHDHGMGDMEVMADAKRMQQVLLNLFENAAQHSMSGSEIVFEAIPLAERACVQMRVRDGGAGMPPEVLEHVFDPFFTTRRGGTGLGLSIVKHFVESHGGSISASNNVPPPGCTIDVVLPLAPQKKGEEKV